MYRVVTDVDEAWELRQAGLLMLRPVWSGEWEPANREAYWSEHCAWLRDGRDSYAVLIEDDSPTTVDED